MHGESAVAIAVPDTQLLQYLDRRLPRYTSYPTAVQFGPNVDCLAYEHWLGSLPAEEQVSLYLHVPFCAELCLYCACHTTVARRYGPIEAYVEILEREIALVGRHLGVRCKAVHVHWGGGTPTMLMAADFERIMLALRHIAAISADCEVAIEIDPRTLRRELVPVMANAGVNRASLGVQDFDQSVQRAVGRIQSFEQTARAAEWLRDAGITNINLDLMYGLPFQTTDGVSATARKALALEPDRVALFGYAHVPWLKRHQHLLPEDALPDTVERLAQARAAAEVLGNAGYRPIGLDHFAKAHDLLVIRQREKRLHRNFQGYTTDAASTLIGFGTSAIGMLPQGYVQNATSTVAYREAIRSGALATARGRELTAEDRLRRSIIEHLMCDLAVDLAEITAAHSRSPGDLACELARLAPFAAHGLLDISGATITVAEHARPFVRSICAVFDAYLTTNTTQFSRAL
ncbi:MAG: oxygen-independent coproporphyrinogen III oxidase [Rhodospirillales bacterium]|nr:oxygen-independent coproporphyrinogen III oxidase [Rhodospirillales bacterium]